METIQDLSTVTLLDILQDIGEWPYTHAQAAAELRARVVPQNDPETEWRGGIRPTNPNL